MNKEKNIGTIGSTLATAKAALEQKMKDKEAQIKTEVEKQTALEQAKLLEAMEDPEKLSPAHAKQRLKQQQKIITGSTITGGLIGSGAFAVTMMAPSISTAIGGLLAGTMLAGVPVIAAVAVAGLVAATAITAAAYGLGIVQSKLMPLTPTLLTEQKTEIENKAKEKIETEMIGNQLCQLRLERTTGKLNHLEFAEVCEAMYDLAILQHKIPESIAQKLRDSAQEARVIHKEESQEKREEEKLELDKDKVKKEELRNDKKEEREERREDLVFEKAKEEIEINKILAVAKLRQSSDADQINDVVTKLFGDGADSNLLNMMMLQKVMSSSGARAAA